MKIWTPPQQISEKEIVGRRAFGSKIFNHRNGEPLRYRISVFEDDRPNTGLSVDRLGVRTPKNAVLEFLEPFCEVMAERGSTTFKGWVQLCVADLRSKISVTDAEGEQNPYHAEIDRSPYTTVQAMRALAFELCVYASKYEFVEKPSAS